MARCARVPRLGSRANPNAASYGTAIEQQIVVFSITVGGRVGGAFDNSRSKMSRLDRNSSITPLTSIKEKFATRDESPKFSKAAVGGQQAQTRPSQRSQHTLHRGAAGQARGVLKFLCIRNLFILVAFNSFLRSRVYRVIHVLPFT